MNQGENRVKAKKAAFIAAFYVCFSTVSLYAAQGQTIVRDSSPYQGVSEVSPEALANCRLPSANMDEFLSKYHDLIKFDGVNWPSCFARGLKNKFWFSLYDESYSPTMLEVFDSTARQIGMSFRFDKDQGWFFESPPMPLPFHIQVAKGYRMYVSGHTVRVISKRRDAGLEIAMLGKYSGLDENQCFSIQEKMAKKNCSSYLESGYMAKLSTKTLCSKTSSFFENSPDDTKKQKVQQWTLFQKGQLFCITTWRRNGDQYALSSISDMLDNLTFN